MKRSYSILLLLLVLVCSSCQKEVQTVRIAVTTDVHGTIFPYDFLRQKDTDHSLAHVHSYAMQEEGRSDTLFFLLDNGDFLQGQPAVYYYNFVDTLSPHLGSSVMNELGYDAATVGNHDIETGPAVYKRLKKAYHFPWLAANAVDEESGEPAFPPYGIMKAGKYKIAVMGLITPGIPNWLPKSLWPDMEFADMTETAAKWMPVIQEEEKPDLVVGLFHSGTDMSYGGDPEPYMNENAVLHVARTVPGFDVIFAGHDHRVSVDWIENTVGDSVLIVDPGSHARYAGEVTLLLGPDGPQITEVRNVPMSDLEASPSFLQQFESERKQVDSYLNDTITWLSEDLTGLDALFGPSTMSSLIHTLQLELSGAEISFTAPLSLHAHLHRGPLRVYDMFNLYRFENMLYTMRLSGEEIDGFLEHATGNWFNTMSSGEDHMLLFDPDNPGRLAHPYYNFSSAAGIDYSIDLRKAPGSRVDISGFSDGRPFHPDSSYTVAVNSYRGNGGGGHLTTGSGIPADGLSKRVLWASTHDLRYHLMQSLAARDTLAPTCLQNWNALPEGWVSNASLSDRKLFE